MKKFIYLISLRFESFSIFFLLSIPSIKLIYSSSIINFIPFFILAVCFLIKKSINVTNFKKKLILYWSIFTFFIFFFFINGLYLDSLETIIKYLFLYFSVLLIIITVSYKHLVCVNLYLIIWGVFLSIWQIVSGIPTQSELGQHYLTVSLPIGVALSNSLVVLIYGQNINKTKRFIYLLLTLVTFFSLTTLLSRSAIIFPIVILLLCSILILLFSKRSGFFKRVFYILFLLVLFQTSYTYLIESVEFRQMNRLISTLGSPEKEYRIDRLYEPAINFIQNSPIIGYGTNSSKFLLGYYPHNIFLEVLLTGGVFLLSIFLIFIFKFIYYFFKTIIYLRENVILLGFSSSALFFLLQWNTSFDLTVSYIPLGAMFIFIIGYYDQNKKTKT